MIMKKLEVKIIRKLDNDFIEKWSNLVNGSVHAHFFNTSAWFISCLNTYDINEYYIFAAYEKGELVGVLPLIKSKKFFVDVFASPGKKYLEKSTILLRNGNSYILEKIISKVARYGNIYFSEVSEVIASSLSKGKFKAGLLTLSSINPFINLKESSLGTLSKKQRQKITSKIKKNLHNLKFGHYRDNLGPYLQNIFELEGRSSKKLAHKDSFADLTIRKLFTSLINYAKGYVIIDFVYYKNLPIVSSFGFVYKDRYLAYHTSFDNNFRSFIPGKLITFKMLTKLCEEGFSLFDFSRGHNEFKNDFTKNYVFQYDFYYSKNALIRAWWEGINFARRLKQLLVRSNNSLDSKFLFKKFGESKFQFPKLFGLQKARYEKSI